MFSTPVVLLMITCMMFIWYVAHRVAHMIVTEYGLLGGLVAMIVIYTASLVMDHYGLKSESECIIENPPCVNISFPNLHQRFAAQVS